MDPPPCVQNAMMKQDKKPFTYTPGGIDLSEIKSPRMARRIERNAAYTGEPEAPRAAPQAPTGPLPPSALAAMQPQLHVQVFPSGPPPPPPGPRGGPPPPPPPPMNIPPPPPPPPPSGPLPTKKVVTSENQVLERPDMTKIIPDNPMAMLRKTGGPSPRDSFIDELYGQKTMKTPPLQQQPSQRWPQNHQIQQKQQVSPPVQPQGYQPRIIERTEQPSPPVQPEPQRYQPKIIERSEPSPPPRYQPKVVERKEPPQSPPTYPEPQRYHPKVIERVPSQEEPVKTSTAHLGSLYIPPINQQQQRSVASPPAPPKRDPQSPQIQSPSTPTLKEAPRPWQKQQKQSEEIPTWAKKEPVAPPLSQQQPSQNEQQQHPNAVYVTQPLVFQHPGPPPNRQQPPPNRPQPKVDAQGAVIIPVQIERKQQVKPATPGTPATPSLNRQQSWGNAPPQSNSFKVLQKITQTDGAEEDENAPVTEHGPRYPQQFQQPPADQMRKLKLSDGDRELMNRFRQGVDEDTSLHNEVDPRYRGPAIPSKAFKLLQSMTDGSSDTPIGATVSRGPTPSGNRSPQVRTIPIQIERDDQPKNYVHPSEQTVPEPKKYTGSSIPSRSFKILQAMTAPDSCANANEVNENYDPSSYNQWGYDPNYPPPYPPPYWPDYYYYYQNSKESENEKDIRQTPVPYWGYYPPPPSPYPFMQRPLRTPDTETDTARNTPLPWGYYPYYPPPSNQEPEDSGQQYYQYPPYWDPYYYYYGYPPMYSPYPFYESNDSEEVGYSSTDEMAYFSKKFKNEREQVKTPQIVVTEDQESERETSDSDSETEVETEEECSQTKRSQSGNGLQAIRSVKDIRVYDNEQNEEEEEEEDHSEEEDEETEDSVSYIIADETIPHQLSVIFEESERSESKRESSVLSDSTTIADKSEDEEEETNDEKSAKLPLQIRSNEEVTTVTVGESQVKIDEDLPKPETEAVIKASDDKNIPSEDKTEEEEEQDWWGILNKDDDVLPARPKTYETYKDEEEKIDDASSTSSSNSSSSQSSKKEVQEDEDSSSESESSESSSDSEEEKVEEKPEPLSIKERIQALKDSINAKKESLKGETEIKMSVKEKVSAIENGLHNSKPTSTKSSVKSFEEFSEEEGDSGVTSDMSRHISDNEEFQELKKMTRYQRAATHSRLFKLLQEVCEGEEEDEDANEDKMEAAVKRRDQLSLPLTTSESFCSSGIPSPGSPLTERLVSELVQSILKRKKGQVFRNLPKEKLQAAARKILMEEFDDLSTPDSSFLSPLRSTESSTPAQTPQEYYTDYKQYYDSWSDADVLLAKYPKNELLRLMAESHPSSDPSLEPSEVTSAS